MSVKETNVSDRPTILSAVRRLPWDLWSRQILAVCRLELKKSFLGRRAIPIYLLASMPVLLFAARLLVPLIAPGVTQQGPGFASMLYAGIFQTFMLRFVIFFGCVGVFMNLFRGEVLDKSLHYYFLSPVRREVLLAGKYLSGLITTTVLFGGATALSFLLVYLPYGGMVIRAQFLEGPAVGHLAAYVAVTALACIGYGAVFLATGLFFRNPVIPAVAIMGWESIIFLLPPLLKKISIAYYLLSLCPVQLSGGPIEIIAEPSPPSIAVPGILGISALLLLLACRRVRRMEVSYGAD